MLKKRGLFFRRMLVLYAVSTTVIFLLFGMVVSIYEQKNYVKQIQELNERGLAQSANACATTLRNLYDYFNMEILDSPELLEILLAKEFSPALSVSFNSLNKKMVNYSDLIHSCYVINRVSDFACSTRDTYRSLEDFSDQDMIGRIAMYDDTPYSYLFCPREADYTLNGRNYREKYISIIFRVYREGFLVINLDYDVFADMINYRNESGTSRTLLINKQGQVMIDSTMESFGRDVSEQEYYKMLEVQEEDSGCFQMRRGKAPGMICYRKNELFGFSSLTITESMIFNKEMLLHMVLYSVGAMALNLCCVLVGTIICYRPVGKLSNLLAGTGTDHDECHDEFQMIEKLFKRMKKENRQYVKSQREKLIKALLEDRNITADSDWKELEQLKKEMDRQAFLCINLYPEKDQTWEDDHLLLFSMENILRELIEDFARMEAVNRDGWLSCVVNIDWGEEFHDPAAKSGDGRLEHALQQMQSRMAEYFKMHVTCVVGYPVTELLDLSESAASAQTAFFFQFTKETDGILYWNEDTAEKEEKQTFPLAEAQAILDAVKSSDKGKIRNTIPLFFQRISKYNYHQALRCIFELEFELTRFELRNEIYLEHREMEALENKKMDMKLYRLQELCLERCLQTAEAYREIRDNNSNKKEIVERVKTLVDENIMNSDLTVNFLAQNVYLSISYLRSIFKEVMGETLSNYIIRKRVEKLCSLLENTDMPVSEIADRMGFSTKNYLFTFFKNYMGMTPNEYRKKKRNQSGEL